MNFSAVILAGGKSSRMGRDKAFLEIEGQTLLERQLQLARNVGAAEIFISSNSGGDYSRFGYPILTDKFQNGGPVAGIERALDATSLPLLFVLAVDMPRMDGQFLHRIMAKCQEDFGAIARVDGEIEPLAAFYPKSAHALLGGFFDTRFTSVKKFAEDCVRNHLATFVNFAAEDRYFFSNWNSPADVNVR